MDLSCREKGTTRPAKRPGPEFDVSLGRGNCDFGFARKGKAVSIHRELVRHQGGTQTQPLVEEANDPLSALALLAFTARDRPTVGLAIVREAGNNPGTDRPRKPGDWPGYAQVPYPPGIGPLVTREIAWS